MNVHKDNNHKIELQLSQIYKDEMKKFTKTIKERCEKKSSKGMEQMIGRRFGNFWEKLIKKTFELSVLKTEPIGTNVTTKKLVIDILKSKIKDIGIGDSEKISSSLKKQICKIMSDEPISLSDLTYSKKKIMKSIDTKWRIRWNDSKTVNAQIIAASILKTLGYKPILLIKTTRDENIESNLNRFEEKGWVVLTNNDSMVFVKSETGFDLKKWIDLNIDFWSKLSLYHKCLNELRYDKDDFNFCA